MSGHKKISDREIHKRKQINENRTSFDRQSPIWLFDHMDRDGAFAFNVRRAEFDATDFLEKMIAYSQMTWGEIKAQTHDDGKSEHHALNFDTLSKEAKLRIEKCNMGEYADSIFSFAFNNTLRVIGVKQNEFFHVVWYDPKHGFSPSKKRHT